METLSETRTPIESGRRTLSYTEGAEAFLIHDPAVFVPWRVNPDVC